MYTFIKLYEYLYGDLGQDNINHSIKRGSFIVSTDDYVDKKMIAINKGNTDRLDESRLVYSLVNIEYNVMSEEYMKTVDKAKKIGLVEFGSTRMFSGSITRKQAVKLLFNFMNILYNCQAEAKVETDK